MNVFQKNVAILRSQDPALASQVLNTSGGILSIQPSKAGVPTAVVNNRSIHSAYDPVREAEQWATHQANDCQAGEALVVLGVGLWYHVEALLGKVSQDSIIMIVVPSLSELVDGLAVRTLDGWGERVKWV